MLALALFALVAEPTANLIYDPLKLDWQASGDRAKLHSTLSGFASFCSQSFGFSSVVAASDQMPNKINAHLLLAESPTLILSKWNEFAHVAKASSTDSDAKEAMRFIEAAVSDPNTHGEAKKRFIEKATAGERRAFAVCQTGVDDPFINQNYLRGDGKTTLTEQDAAALFDRTVKGILEPEDAPK